MFDISVLVKNVGEDIVYKEIECSLESMQSIVGGYIERLRITQDIDMWLNEEGILMKLPLNVITTNRGEAIDHIYGNVVFASHDDEGNIISLSEDQKKWIISRMKPHGFYKDGSLSILVNEIDCTTI